MRRRPPSARAQQVALTRGGTAAARKFSSSAATRRQAAARRGLDGSGSLGPLPSSSLARPFGPADGHAASLTTCQCLLDRGEGKGDVARA
jgi:hypothetical protein